MLKGRRVLRSTAPENSLKTPENSPKSEFSTLWKHFFHCVEKSRKLFPLCGKIAESFSIAWKNRQNIFHCVENSADRTSKKRLRYGYGRCGGGVAFLVKRQQGGRGGLRGGLVLDGWPVPRKNATSQKALILGGFADLRALKLILSKHLAEEYACCVLNRRYLPIDFRVKT